MMPPAPLPGRETVAALLDRLLDRGYEQATRAVLEAILSTVNTGVMAVRLNQLENRASELAAAGEALSASDPIVRAVLADFDEAVAAQRGLLSTGASHAAEQGAQAAGVAQRQLALGGVNDDVLARIGVTWNTPDPEAVQALVNVTSSDAWRAELSRYAEDAGERVRNIALNGIIEGRNPVSIAREVREAITGIPAYRANNLMRTAQLHSYRTASAVYQAANADLAQRIVRIGTLDDRICMCCVALHGTEIQPGEPVQDHHQGRCTSVMIVRGREVTIRTGEAWFRAQPEARQLNLMGDAAYEAWRAGQVELRDFVQPYDDPVFGRMVREASLKSIVRSRAS